MTKMDFKTFFNYYKLWKAETECILDDYEIRDLARFISEKIESPITAKVVSAEEAFDGRECTNVYSFPEIGIVCGWDYVYSSWGSGDYDQDPYELVPVQKMVPVYVTPNSLK
jgi:hypothetical protein